MFEGFAQIENKVTKSGVGGGGEGVFFVNTYPFSFKDESGYTVVLGEIYNNHNFPINDVKILVNFYNEVSNEPIDSVIGNPILDSIPALGSSPIKIKSSFPNSAISQVNMTLLGFDSSYEKSPLLLIETNSLEISNSLNFSGTITNYGNEDTGNIKIHLMSTDVFEPPRIVNISSINLENIISGSSQKFSIDGMLNSMAVNYYILAESDNYSSPYTIIDHEKINSQNKIITINDVAIINIKQDNSIISSPIRINTQIMMQEFTSMSIEIPYTFYVQIKEADSGLVEFIGSYSAMLYETSPENPTILWIPENEGLFFIETYLWDIDDVVLSSPGQVILVNVNAE
jgi:hypothetical protein